MLSLVFISGLFLGYLHGQRQAIQHHVSYVEQQTRHTLRIIQAQQQIATKTDIIYRDRIKTIYLKGKTIEKIIPHYITKDDNAFCSINTGFVHLHNAAWGNATPGTASESDRQPSGISLTELADTTTHNATACHAWREQALGLREFYWGVSGRQKSK